MESIRKAIEIAGSATNLAKKVGVSVQSVCFWRDGRRSVPINKCAAIERATNRAVTRKELRPDDWQDIWPELADNPQLASPKNDTPA